MLYKHSHKYGSIFARQNWRAIFYKIHGFYQLAYVFYMDSLK